MERYVWEDRELGTMILNVRVTARHFIFRIKDGGIVVTVPPFAKIQDISKVIDSNRLKLQMMLQTAKAHKNVFDEGDIIVTHDFIVVFNYPKLCIDLKINVYI